jgi:hypothetical protein
MPIDLSGLLNGSALFGSGAEDPNKAAMSALAAQLLMGSGYSPQRTSFGQQLGAGLQAGAAAKSDAIQNAQKNEFMKAQIQAMLAKQQQQYGTHVVGNSLVDDTGKVLYQSSALDNTFGRVNPGDYDPASLAKFQETGNWSDLKRIWAPVNPTVQNIGGVPTVVQPSRTGAAPTQSPLSTLPNEIGAATQKAAAEASASASGKITGERTGKAPTAYAAYKAGVASLENAMNNTATGPFLGRMPALTATQQTAEGAEATMAPILKDLFRSSGEGTFTEGDQALLLKMVPTRTDHEEARKAKLAMIDEIVRAKLGIDASGSPAGSPNIQSLIDKYAPK